MICFRARYTSQSVVGFDVRCYFIYNENNTCLSGLEQE